MVRLIAILGFAAGCAGAELTLLPEHARPDPYGGIIAADRSSNSVPARSIRLEGARAAYVSCQLVASLPEPGEYRLEVRTVSGSGIQPELYREWFHFVPAGKQYYPDALVPVRAEYRSRMPEPDNRIARQTNQAFWLDIWIPADARTGSYEVTANLEAAGRVSSVSISLNVLAAIVPAQDAVAMDHNSYGVTWLAAQYPELHSRIGDDFFTSPEFFALIHSYHRIFYEHRGVFHQLGYGHAGKVGPEFAPRLEGSGKTRRIADWTLYDRHYGPLLDGTAFASTHRGPRPIPFVYLPINPEWPASYLWWGEPGYQREFVNVVSAMERHFRDKGWTHTNFELFFNQKKRYKGFPWDGDEARFVADYAYLREYARLMKLAVPADSPVPFVFRADVSWTMERQFRELAGVINFWVCGGGMFTWYKGASGLLKKRGDIVWIYGGTPPVTKSAAHATIDVLKTWVLGTDGFVRWLVTSPGDDPWFRFEGGGEAMVYPGGRFGIDGPIPSIRLKIERNAVQDLTLLDSFRKTRPLETLRAEASRRFNGTPVDAWWSPRPPLADRNPEEWSNADIDDALPKDPRFDAALDSAAWARVRSYVIELAREVR